ncbi:ABC transporter permease subunit [Actinoplanes sp. NPDC051494]|uniref:ABC transporter permease subunit n=1 Tax=Actinoplanes sp. NPDC051494 TaxID=3363907 RepID=UPI00379DB88E
MSLSHVVRSEWIKFWSVRSTAVLLSVAVTGFAGIGLLLCAAGMGASVVSPAGTSMTGSVLATLVLGVLGVLVITGEYRTGLIRATLTATPRRSMVLAAKAAVLGAVSFTVMSVAALLTFLAGQAIIGDAGMTLTDDGVIRVLLGTVAYEAGAALLGLFLGTLIRSTAAALSTYFAVMFLLATTFTQFLLPEGVRAAAGRFLPPQAGEAMGWAGARLPEMLSPGQGALVFAGYLVLAAVVAGWRLRHSDA